MTGDETPQRGNLVDEEKRLAKVAGDPRAPKGRNYITSRHRVRARRAV